MGKLNASARFTSSKITTIAALSGVCLVAEKDKLHFYSTNLSAYFHTTLKVTFDGTLRTVVDPKKILEFLNLLPSSGKITLDFQDKQLLIMADKTRGSFPLIDFQDFPFPPKITEKFQTIKTKFLSQNLPLVTFSASTYESRAALIGVNFVSGEDLIMVATDGFRLSLIRTKKEIEIPSVIIPSNFLLEALRLIGAAEETRFGYLKEEKIVVFSAGETELYSRLIEGDFPPYEKVIPSQKVTTATIDREELLRGVKIASVFARDFSNIITLSFKRAGLEIRPKTDGSQENAAFSEALLEGEEQKIAFNFKFLLDFLNHVDGKKIIVEILRPDAPIVFRTDKYPQFIHIIMPVRIQEGAN